MRWETFGKVFLHGLAFIGISVVLFFGWVYFTLFLVTVGYLLGLVIGVVLLFVVVGYINRYLGSVLWGINGEPGVVYSFFHGLLLVVFLAVVNFLFVVLPNLMWREVATGVVTFFVGVFLNGAIGREVASWFKRKEEFVSDEYVGE